MLTYFEPFENRFSFIPTFFVISTVGENPFPEQSEGSIGFLVAAAPQNDKFKIYVIKKQ